MEISYDIRVKLISNVRFIISFGVEWIKQLSLYLEDQVDRLFLEIFDKLDSFS